MLLNIAVNNNMQKPTKIYRLDTLRAFAVLIVVIFHLNSDFLPWGYIGVDMFFTLSGFLMSYLYLSSPDEMTIKNFVKRRFWRLFPSLIIVVFFTIIISALVFSTYHLLETSKSSIYAIFSLSNFYFHSQSGYFDIDSNFKPLLHTWSLGVEEQFYFIFAILIFINRWICLKKSIIFLTLMSFSAWILVVVSELSFIITPIHDEPFSSLFYLTQYRIFQFTVGGLTAYAFLSGHIGLRIWGFLFLAVSAILASNISLAYLSAPVVALGMSGLMLNGSFLDNLATNTIISYFAKISYQLYLVHWPIIVLWQYITFSSLSWIEAILCSMICIISAHALHKSTDWMRYS